MSLDTTYLREDERTWLERARVRGNFTTAQAEIIAERLIEERRKNDRITAAVGHARQTLTLAQIGMADLELRGILEGESIALRAAVVERK